MDTNKFNYSKLRGKIKEKFHNQRNFAESMNMSHVTLSGKINNKVGWNQTEMIKACYLLDGDTTNILEYFFRH